MNGKNPMTGIPHGPHKPVALRALPIGPNYGLEFVYADDPEFDPNGFRPFIPARKLPAQWSGDAVSDLAVELELPVIWWTR